LQRWQEAMRDRCVCLPSRAFTHGPLTSRPFFSFYAGRLLVWRRWRARRMDTIRTFDPFLHLRLFLCIFLVLVPIPCGQHRRC
jgi:hypothetical protein